MLNCIFETDEIRLDTFFFCEQGATAIFLLFLKTKSFKLYLQLTGRCAVSVEL